jgi:hypothetical protein
MGNGFDETYNAVRRALKDQASGDFSAEKKFWVVIEGIAAILDETVGSGFSTGASGLQWLYDKITGSKGEPGAQPNPWFVWNGQDEGPTSYTRRYLKNRDWKGRGATAIGIAGGAAQAFTVVDVGSMAVHANALGSTGVHMIQLKQIADSYKQTRTIGTWIDIIMKMKALKAGVRTAGLLGSAIPVPMVGTATGVLAAAATMGAKLTMTKVCLATSADLHWRAFQELKLTGAFGGGTGPALRIMHELFYRRGATRVFGQYDVHRIIQEPNGWLAVQDKLMLF